jgi:pseudouridine-5'-phosphate glycosidase
MIGTAKPVLGEEVAAALAAGRPVVALESTIITHGMPYPENLAMARGVEAVIREAGAVPATIAVLDGRLRAGLSDAEVERLGAAKDAVKASSRDLATCLVRGQTAGTTVSATMRVAELAGIPIFATGGVGGVHRGAESTFDISADLIELGRTPTAVVCAGVKSILDIPKTLEVLETQRVPVIGFDTQDFPAFFSRRSGETIDQRADTPDELARMIRLHRALGSGTGLLVANPIPVGDAIDGEEIDSAIGEAVAEAARKGIAGKAVTPFLLSRIVEMTGGRSLTANIALVRNNARVAAETAVAFAALIRGE